MPLITQNLMRYQWKVFGPVYIQRFGLKIAEWEFLTKFRRLWVYLIREKPFWNSLKENSQLIRKTILEKVFFSQVKFLMNSTYSPVIWCFYTDQMAQKIG